MENTNRAATEGTAEALRHVERLTQLNENLTDECQRVEAELAEANTLQRKSQSTLNEVARLTAMVSALELDLECGEKRQGNGFI